MEIDDYIAKFISCNEMLHEQILSDNSFSQKDLELVHARLGSLIKQLYFWQSEGNMARFCYELRNHTHWLLKFSS